MVGFLDIFREAAQKDKHMIDNLINCNCTEMTKMFDIVLPGMMEKNKGIIINNCVQETLIMSPHNCATCMIIIIIIAIAFYSGMHFYHIQMDKM